MPTVSVAPEVQICPNCQAEGSAEAEACPSCGRRYDNGSPRLVLAIVIIAILVGFTGTEYFVKLHHVVEADLAHRWFSRGEAAMRLQVFGAAADDYRTALSYDPENSDYRLRLAEALLAGKHYNEARSHLQSLWEEQPADGEVNLALARLYAGMGNAAEAVRYYRNAINGVWDHDALAQRVATRFELVEYLMGRHDTGQAAVELAALMADAPPDVAGQLRLGALLRQANLPARALKVYDGILKDDPHNVEALIGQGDAALALANYQQAERSFDLALHYDPNHPNARKKLELMREIVRIDPNLHGLSHAEQARRVAAAFDTASKRLQSCAAERGVTLTANLTASSAASGAPNNLQLLYMSGQQREAAGSEASLRANPDAMDPVMQYVGDVERATQAVCPNLSLTDEALLTMAQQGSGAPQ